MGSAISYDGMQRSVMAAIEMRRSAMEWEIAIQ